MLSITDYEVYNAVASFIALVVPGGTPILRGQQNRISMPDVDCVVMTTLGATRRIGTNFAETVDLNWEADDDAPADSNLPAGGSGFAAEITSDFEYSIQVDFYSATPGALNQAPPPPVSESWAMAAELLWRSKIGWNLMPDGIKPLYSEGRQQLPIVAGEDQWIQRWTMTLVLDYQPTWSQETQAATSATVIPEPIDVFFPPVPAPSDWTADGDLTADSDLTI